MIIGTHRDLEDNCKTENRLEKNRKLAKILLPTFEDEALYYKIQLLSLAKEDKIDYDVQE